MGLRFRKSYKVAPGVKVNLNKKSTSVTFCGKGAHHTVSSTGKKSTSVGLPGTGMYYTSSSGGTSSVSDGSAKISDSSPDTHKTKDIHDALSKFSDKTLKKYCVSFLVFAIIFTLLTLMCVVHKEVAIAFLCFLGVALSFGAVKTYSSELSYRSKSSDDDFSDLSEKIYQNTDFEEVNNSGKPPKNKPRGCGCLMVIVLLIVVFIGVGSCTSDSDTEEKKDAKKTEEVAALEGITISADTSVVYDVNTQIPVELSVSPSGASLSNLVCSSSGGTFLNDGTALTFSADTDGMYILYVSCGDIKSNEITIEVEDKAAKAAREAAEVQQVEQQPAQQQSTTYVINTSTGKFHVSSCSDVSKISPDNYMTYEGNRDDLINQGYSPCGHCNP